ncbi:MAG: hypothetical protein KGI50_05535 [Patescibacteria group bacterium]|nr:hypothetical protein [Patescibacteria group bacterium]MDE2438905.1 hypothetical protein [Patescibacteria group bacterium]
MRQSETSRDRQVKGFAQFCIGHLKEHNHLTVKEIVAKTKLCAGTIYRLQNGKCSTKTHIGTIQKLAAATGSKLSLAEIEPVEPIKLKIRRA